MRNSALSVAALAVAAAGLLTACSGSDPAPMAPDSGSSAPAAAAPAPSAATPPGAQVLPPSIVGPGVTAASVPSGQSVVFTVDDPAAWAIVATDPNVLAVQPGSDDGSSQTNPSGVGLAEGTTTVTLTGPGGVTRQVLITVTPAPAIAPDAGVVAPSAPAPAQ